MTRFFASTLLVAGLGLGSSCTTPTIEQEFKSLDATERQALTDLLKGTGVAPEGLRSIGILGLDAATDKPRRQQAAQPGRAQGAAGAEKSQRAQ